MPYENANGVIGDFEPVRDLALAGERRGRAADRHLFVRPPAGRGQEGSCRYWSSVLCTVNRAVYDQLFEVFAQEQAGAEVPGARFVRRRAP